MSKVCVFVNQKGGVGKTTSVINLGAYLAEAGKKCFSLTLILRQICRGWYKRKNQQSTNSSPSLQQMTS